MKAGDLVKPIGCVPPQNRFKVGLVMEWDAETEQAPAAGWVLWQGQYDWDIVYEGDIEVISESR